MKAHRTPYRSGSGTGPQGLSAALLVRSPTLACADVTAALGIEPTETSESDPTSPYEFQRRSTWALSSSGVVRSADLRDHIDWLLEQVFPAKARLAAMGKRESVEAWVSLRFPQASFDGPTLWPRHLKSLADLGLEVSFSSIPRDCPSPEG